ncbi:GNAT family N-acetyltransferase [Streptomyces sp. DH37]|uniref:GNAT family N-acetyltransferase n=1 Tax=Streptomyces sp. DH37 TaxID=3040122 RepID=UPI00244217A0|nr:GNAT family N-acetyltransferase [Streptomyces sp. DH37]MDG9702844.1 GNAT family N-acetyltransferase [Streptomyces sp. DH37]
MVLGDLVKLRAMGPPDAEALWRWNHDPDVMRWMDEDYAQPLALTVRWLEERQRNAYGDVLFGIEALADGELVGLVRLHGAEPETGCADLDIYLGEKARRSAGGAATPPTRCGRPAATASSGCGCTGSR